MVTTDMNGHLISDPVEAVIAEALKLADIPFIHEAPTGRRCIDFYLPNQDVYIECKRFYSDRTEEQMSSCENIIVIQGMEAARFFGRMIIEALA